MRASKRERVFVIGGACVLAVFLLIQLGVYPAVKRNQELDRLLPQKEKELREIRQLHRELGSLKEARAVMLQRVPPAERAIAPLSRLDRWIERSNLRPNVRSIKPSPSVTGEGMIVVVLLEKADLPQLVRFLYEIQSSPGGFRIDRLAVKPRYTTPRYLDISLELVFYQI